MPAPTKIVGAPCWIDLYSSDTDRATAFYGGLLGWVAEEPDPRFGGYFVYTKDGRHVAGCMGNDGSAGMPDGWTVYLQTDDVAAVAESAPAQGGSIDVPPMQVADHGTMALISDPGGARLGVWQPDRMEGLQVIAEPGAPAWFEVHTRDFEPVVDFYRHVFGWDTHVLSDTDEFRYTTLGADEGARAGIFDATAALPEGEPAAWSVYFAVEDTDRALEQVVELGGSVGEPARDTPYGRIAAATDPTGARFKLVAS